MSDLRKAAQQALEAYDSHEPLAVVMDELRAALECCNVRTSESLCPEQVRTQPELCRDDIIRLAIEAGFDAMETHLRTTYVSTPSDIERFANLVAAAEREACAWVAEDWDTDSADPRDVAAAIRSRSNQ